MEGKKVSESRMVMAQLMIPSNANPAGNVHGGDIMKMIDNAAGVVAGRHARAYTAVTASIDRIDFHHPVFIGELLTLSASVNFVGHKSMEIGVRVEAENLVTGKKRHTGSAYLTFVALDANHRPIPLPPVIPETDADRRRNAEAAERRKMRLAEKKKEKS